MKELPPLEVLDCQSAEVILSRLEYVQGLLETPKSYEDERINTNVLRYWERAGEDLILQILAVEAMKQAGVRDYYRFFPLPK